MRAAAALAFVVIVAGAWWLLRPAPAPPPTDLRPAIQRAIAEQRVSTTEELSAYLDALEQQARKKGRVSGLEVEPGVEAIRKLGGGPEDVIAFTERMQRVQAELATPAQ